MTTRSIPVIDPAGAAARSGATGENIVVAIIGTGIDGSHPHFARHANLDLPPPLRHYDLTLLREREGFLRNREDLVSAPWPEEPVFSAEALLDLHGHGTHAAGIVAGYVDRQDADLDRDREFMSGVAPKCKLLSLKVIDDTGRGSELDIIRAVDLVRTFNRRAGKIAVHAVLINITVSEDVSNYACGHTPVCEAIERLTDSGVVVIVPAGNNGIERIETEMGTRQFFGLMTISDPGNAESAITIGSTHRRAYEYGASYFSGRGPTRDGRLKPDLLAPGEKIESAHPVEPMPPSTGKRTKRAKKVERRQAPYAIKDGTSMAAAHVAGAVAVLLSARPALIGRPKEVKDLLLSTATDLGRHEYLQGRGLLNLSHALGEQAVTQPAPAAEPLPPAKASHLLTQVLSPPETPAALQPAVGRKYMVAFSYPGEHRLFVTRVVIAIRRLGFQRDHIFYDQFREGDVIGIDADTYLLDVYTKQSELTVVFLTAEYNAKEWTGLEWRGIRDLIKTKRGHAVLPVRLDETPIPGLLSTDIYIPPGRDPEDIALTIFDKLQSNRKKGLA